MSSTTKISNRSFAGTRPENILTRERGMNSLYGSLDVFLQDAGINNNSITSSVVNSHRSREQEQIDENDNNYDQRKLNISFYSPSKTNKLRCSLQQETSPVSRNQVFKRGFNQEQWPYSGKGQKRATPSTTQSFYSTILQDSARNPGKFDWKSLDGSIQTPNRSPNDSMSLIISKIQDSTLASSMYRSAKKKHHKLSQSLTSTNYSSIEPRILVYEKKYGSLLKKEAEELQANNKSAIKDNFIEVKVDKTHPVIFGLAQNYWTQHQTANNDQILNRHKMKKGQYLVGSIVKYIESAQERINISNYDKSFNRMKDSVIHSGKDTSRDLGVFSQLDNDIINRHRENALKSQAIEQKSKRYNKNGKNSGFEVSEGDDDEDDDDDEDSQYESQKQVTDRDRQELELKEKIAKEIQNTKDLREKNAIKRKFMSTQQAQTQLQRRTILDWAAVRKKGGLESVQKYSQDSDQAVGNLHKIQGQQQKQNHSADNANRDRQSRHNPILGSVDNSEQKSELFSFKSPQIMKRVVNIEQAKVQSIKVKSLFTKAKNKLLIANLLNSDKGSNKNISNSGTENNNFNKFQGLNGAMEGSPSDTSKSDPSNLQSFGEQFLSSFTAKRNQTEVFQQLSESKVKGTDGHIIKKKQQPPGQSLLKRGETLEEIQERLNLNSVSQVRNAPASSNFSKTQNNKVKDVRFSSSSVDKSNTKNNRQVIMGLQELQGMLLVNQQKQKQKVLVAATKEPTQERKRSNVSNCSSDGKKVMKKTNSSSYQKFIDELDNVIKDIHSGNYL